MVKDGLRYVHPSLCTTEQQEREATWEKQEKKARDKAAGKKRKTGEESDSDDEGAKVLGSLTKLEKTFQCRHVESPSGSLHGSLFLATCLRRQKAMAAFELAHLQALATYDSSLWDAAYRTPPTGKLH